MFVLGSRAALAASALVLCSGGQTAQEVIRRQPGNRLDSTLSDGFLH